MPPRGYRCDARAAYRRAPIVHSADPRPARQSSRRRARREHARSPRTPAESGIADAPARHLHRAQRAHTAREVPIRSGFGSHAELLYFVEADLDFRTLRFLTFVDRHVIHAHLVLDRKS